jgi:activating signal cointegrator complex subunit 2
LIESILSGGSTLPTELIELREEVDHLSREQGGLAAAVPSTSSVLQDGSVSERVRVNGTATATAAAPAASYERRNIFDDETLDFSRLRLGKDGSTLPQLGNSIPDHLRDSILRLVETQKEEAEAEARAIAEARGGVYLPQNRDWDGDDPDEGTGDGAPSLRTKGGVDGDDSDAEEETGDKIVEVGTAVSCRVVSRRVVSG